MLKVDIRNLAKNRVYISKKTHITPDIYEKWPYYEYEYLIDDINEVDAEEEKAAKEQEEKAQSSYNTSSLDSKVRSLQSKYGMPKGLR